MKTQGRYPCFRSFWLSCWVFCFRGRPPFLGRSTRPTFIEMGVTKDQSSRSQVVASLTELRSTVTVYALTRWLLVLKLGHVTADDLSNLTADDLSDLSGTQVLLVEQGLGHGLDLFPVHRTGDHVTRPDGEPSGERFLLVRRVADPAGQFGDGLKVSPRASPVVASPPDGPSGFASEVDDDFPLSYPSRTGINAKVGDPERIWKGRLHNTSKAFSVRPDRHVPESAMENIARYGVSGFVISGGRQRLGGSFAHVISLVPARR